MSPEFYLEIANFLNCFLHFPKKSFKLYHIRKFRVHIFMILVVLPDILFYDILVPEDRKLLLQRRFLFYCDVKFNKRSMNIFHHFEQVVGKSNVDRRRIYEFVESIFIQPLNKVIEKNFILMGSLFISLCKLVCNDVKQFILFFAGTVLVLALYYVKVNNADHSHSLGLIFV